MNRITHALPIIAGIIMSSIFGFSFLFTKEALFLVKPFDLLGFRFALAALGLTLLKILGVIKIDFRGKNLKALFMLALFQPVLYFIFETMGVNLTSSSEAGMMMALIPVVVTCFGAIFLNEIPTKIQTFFVGISFLGVAFVVFSKNSGNGGASRIGMLYLVGAILCAAALNILSRKLSTSFKPVEITFAMMWQGAIFFNTIALIQHGITGDIGKYFVPLKQGKVLIAILYLGILSSIIAFFLVNYMLSKIEASRAAVFANLTTVVSIFAGVFIRKEPFTIYQFIGASMILLGVWGTNYYSEKKNISNQRDIDIDEYGN